MKFQSLKLVGLSLVTAIAFTHIHSFAMNSDAMGRSASANSKKSVQGVANPAVQALVDEIQAWIYQRAHNPSVANTKISVREVKPGTYVHNGNIPVTQEVMRDQTITTFTDIGYNIPISRLLQHTFGGWRLVGVSVAELLKKDEKFISSTLTDGDVEKTKAVMQLQAEMRVLASGKLPVQAKVMGAETMISNICKVRPSYIGCFAGVSQKPRMKVTVAFFGDLIQKFAQIGGKAVADDLEKLNNAATVDYYLVQGQSQNEWLLEEVVANGTGLISNKTGFTRISM